MLNRGFKIMMNLLLISVLVVPLNGCQNKTIAPPVNEISDILKLERKAHFDKDAATFFSRFDKNCILVNKGEVNFYDSAAYRQHFDQYLQSSDFIKWDDVKEPVIRFSNDGSMAYAIVEKQVILKNKSAGNRIDTINYAWVSIYEKKNKDWKLVCNASTNK